MLERYSLAWLFSEHLPQWDTFLIFFQLQIYILLVLQPEHSNGKKRTNEGERSDKNHISEILLFDDWIGSHSSSSLLSKVYLGFWDLLFRLLQSDRVIKSRSKLCFLKSLLHTPIISVTGSSKDHCKAEKVAPAQYNIGYFVKTTYKKLWISETNHSIWFNFSPLVWINQAPYDDDILTNSFMPERGFDCVCVCGSTGHVCRQRWLFSLSIFLHVSISFSH